MTRAEFEKRYRTQGKTCKGPTVIPTEERIVLYQRWNKLVPITLRKVLVKEIMQRLGASYVCAIPDDEESLRRLFARLADVRVGCPVYGEVKDVKVYDSGRDYSLGNQLTVKGGEESAILIVEEVLQGHLKRLSILKEGRGYKLQVYELVGGSGSGAKIRVEEIDRGYDFNNTVLSGPLDGKSHPWKCPRCGVGKRYIAPKVVLEE
jgi:hypothetical protein